MKKVLAMILALAMAACAMLSGCSLPQKTVAGSGPRTVVCTVFPFFDWMRELTAGSDGVQVILIADNGVDMHSYQPTTGDIVDISTCDMLVYAGGFSDEWVTETVERSGNDRMLTANLLEMLGDRALCGVPHEDGHDHEDEHEHGGHHDHDAPDEHIWLSAVNARELCAALCDMLCELDSENSELYTANAAGYMAKLSALDEDYRAVTENARVRSLVFADRFPFRYLMNDYNIEYYAAFDGCEAETEASAETVTNLADALDRLELDTVLIIEGSEDRLARTVIESSASPHRQILTLDSMQSVNAGDIAEGVTFLSVMESNLAVLKQALGESGE